MGGGRLSLVGAIERAAAGLDALDPQALQVKPEDRETTALDQSAADGPTTGGPEEPTEAADLRSEEHTSELQSRLHLVCRLLLEKKKNKIKRNTLSCKD